MKTDRHQLLAPGLPRSRGARGNSGFSLFEVIIAVSLFAMISLAVYSTFRTGMRAFPIAST